MKETFPTEDIQFRSARQEVDNLYQVVRRFPQYCDCSFRFDCSNRIDGVIRICE